MVRVSTTEEVSRSRVLSVWSNEVEYATVGSSGWKMTAVAEAWCALMRESGPLCGVEVEVVSLRRFAVGPEEMSEVSTAGAADFEVVQSPTVPSEEAERNLELGL